MGIETVLVAGASGGTGREVLSRLAGTPFETRALTRNRERAAGLEADKTVFGDLFEPDDARRAVEGCDAVLTCVGSTPMQALRGGRLVDGEGNRNLVSAAAAEGVEPFVLESSIGVGDSKPGMPLAFRLAIKPIVDAKERAECHLRDSGVTYTVLRPGGLTDGPATGDLLVGEGGDTVTGRVSRADVARLMIAALFTEEALDRTFEVVSREGSRGGPSSVVDLDWGSRSRAPSERERNAQAPRRGTRGGEMARENFEVRDWDGAARLGELRVPRAGVTVETPALMPVVNPHKQTVPPARLEREYGAEILITNGYILYGSEEFRDRALEEGLHDLFSFDGAIMTDSGSFQLAEYGEINVDTPEILGFQYDIGSDIGTPVDIPTPPDVPRERAESELEETEAALAAAEGVETGEMLVNAPVQGSTYPDLRERAAEHAYAGGLDLFPVGAVVPLMNAYRYDDVVEVVAAAKRGLGLDAPVHLFGAGHPMTFALAAAMGCDLFDSAAYALYARDGRYLTVRGTRLLTDLEYLPCSCPVCTEHSAEGLRSHAEEEQTRLLAEHNLHVSFGEMRTVKGAIRSGDLAELVEARARGHPSMLDGLRTMYDHADLAERSDPVSKGTFFHVSTESARRPEVTRHHTRLERLPIEGERVLLTTGSGNTEGYDATWRVVPPFGPFPRALSESYPLTAEVPERFDRAACERAIEGVSRLVEANPGVEFTLAHHGWPEPAFEDLPYGVRVVRLGGDEEEESGET